MASEIRLGKLAPARGATHKRKRIGCGPGSGHGKTSCRGHKGQGQRKGKEYDERFEGGQMPFFRRLPKRGFKNISRKEFELVKVEQLAKFPANTDITPEILTKENFVKKGYPIKVLGDGEIGVALNVKLHAFSKSAKAKIEKAGGKVEIFKAVVPEKK